jgi:hypothetical protein
MEEHKINVLLTTKERVMIAIIVNMSVMFLILLPDSIKDLDFHCLSDFVYS